MPCELSTFILNCILPAALYGMESHRNSHYAHQFNGILQHQRYDAQMLIYSKEVIEKGKILERSAHTHTLPASSQQKRTFASSFPQKYKLHFVNAFDVHHYG